VIARNAPDRWQLSARQYKLVLSAHIVVSVGWLGIVVAKLAVLFVAATTDGAAGSGRLYPAVDVVNRLFPPFAVAAVVTGVLLALGTKWGLFQYYWVVVKLALTVGVPVTAIQLGDGLVQQPTTAPALLTALSVAHLLMLGAATVISVYKPWGKIWLGRRETAPRPGGQDARPVAARRASIAADRAS
jgi:hypothetical protein